MRIKLAALLLLAGCAYYEQTYMPAQHNWAFRHQYPEADRLFNAFDYGHAIVYQDLIAHPGAPVDRIETDRFDFIVNHLLVHPPAVPLDEEAIGPRYAQRLPEAHAMFEWAHMLHRQIYDIWADDHIPVAGKDSAVATVIRYYRSRGDLAFSTTPKSMSLMDGQFYSQIFRKKYPKFNGLLWSYHWMQIVLYDALIRGTSSAERRANVDTVVRRFRAMLVDPPGHMPTLMPMTAAIAPQFAERYPEAAIIFDNLHSFHDVVADILASPDVAPSRKRAEVVAAAARYRDGTSSVTSVADWRQMSTMMGTAQMGGLPW